MKLGKNDKQRTKNPNSYALAAVKLPPLKISYQEVFIAEKHQKTLAKGTIVKTTNLNPRQGYFGKKHAYRALGRVYDSHGPFRAKTG